MDDLRAIDAMEVQLKSELTSAFALIKGLLGNMAFIPVAFDSVDLSTQCVDVVHVASCWQWADSVKFYLAGVPVVVHVVQSACSVSPRVVAVCGEVRVVVARSDSRRACVLLSGHRGQAKTPCCSQR